MNRIKTNANLRLMAIYLVTFSLLGMGCTSLQQSTSIATDDLYTTPNNTNTIVSNKKIISTENWGGGNKVQNYNSSQQKNKSNSQNYNDNQEGVSTDGEEYQDYQNYQDDRYLRLKVANRNRWSSIDDFGYWNNPSFSIGFGMGYGGFGGFGYGGGWDPFWNNRFGWAGYYGGWGGFGYDPFWGGGWGGFGYDPFWGGGFGGFGGWGGGFGYGGFGGGFGGFGYGGFGGFGGWGGGFGYGGFGYGGWNPYYAGFWNPYRPIYYVGNNNPGYGGNMQQRIATRSMQNSAVTLGAYRNNRGYNNSNNNSNAAIGNTRALSNPVVNNNFGSLVKRVVTNNANVNNGNGNPNGNGGFDRPARYFNNNNSANNSQNRAANSFSAPQSTNSFNSSGGRSGGFNSSGTSAGSARPGRGQNP